MCVFCAEKCLDSQFWSGNDQNIQSLLETMINTETLLQHKQPTVIPSCCSHRFYPPAEREEENNPELVFTFKSDKNIQCKQSLKLSGRTTGKEKVHLKPKR